MADFFFDIVLFDLDGTLVDSNLDLTPAVNHALAQEGRAPLSLDAVRNFIGGGTAAMLQRALEASGGMVSDERFSELSAALLDYYWAHIADHTQAFPGVVEALEALAAKGCKLAVCTNKLEKPARQLLDALDLTKHFSAIYGGDTLGHDRAKPKPDMLLAAIVDCGGGPETTKRTAMVGDSTFDVNAGKNAGLPVVALSFGYNNVPVGELGGDVLIDHFDELVEALESLA